MSEFSDRVSFLISRIPAGKVLSYGAIAIYAGSPRAGRQVARILRTYPDPLPWHRVLGSDGSIRLPEGGGREEQASLLISEGVEVSKNFTVDLDKYQWSTLPLRS
jgi:methylated-DNA-protein-cysteine methyltransferase-like protein